jgi:hypothetical protein
MKQILCTIFLINLLFSSAVAAEKETMYKVEKASLAELLDRSYIIQHIVPTSDGGMNFILNDGGGRNNTTYYLCKFKETKGKAISQCFIIGNDKVGENKYYE